MLPRIISAIGAALTPDEITAATRVVSTRENQRSGVYRVLDVLTGVLVEYHPHKNTAYTTNSFVAGGYGNSVAFKFFPEEVLENPSLGQPTYVFGISDGGKTVVGFADFLIPPGVYAQHAWAWTKDEGTVDLGVYSDHTGWSRASSVSNDGSVIVGVHYGTAGGATPPGVSTFMCTRSPPAVVGGDIVNTTVFEASFIASSVSGDGTVVVGYKADSDAPYSAFKPMFKAFRWFDGEGAVITPSPAGTYSIATGVSDDGNVVVGYYGTIPYSSSTFPLTPRLPVFGTLYDGGGADYGPLVLKPITDPLLPGEYIDSGYVRDQFGNLVYLPQVPYWLGSFVWRKTPEGVTVTDIGHLSGGTYAVATGVSGDGNTVVGFSNDGTGQSAFRYTASEGMVSLGHYVGGGGSVATAVTKRGDTISGVDFIWRKGGGFVFPTPKSDPVAGSLPGGIYSVITCIA